MFSALSPATEAAREPGAVPTVLVTSRPPRHRIDYVDQLIGDDSEGQAPGGAKLEFHTSPSRAYGVDVIHLTDIARVVGDEQVSARKRMRRAKHFTKLLRRRRIALVRTARGEEMTRAPSPPEALLDAAAACVITLTVPAEADGRAYTYIGHSHLRDRFLGFPREEPLIGRSLVVSSGILHPAYEAMLKVFGAADLPDWTLRIAGEVPFGRDESYARTVADHVDTISLRNESLSDAALVSEVSRAEIVMIAAPETFESQSTLMLALSLNRPVLVEDSAHTQALANEVGESWVHRHAGPLTAHALETALADLRAEPPTGYPNLDSRDPNKVRAQYIRVYRDALAGR